ncbi:MAG TPA: hypothetical protein VLA39_01680 [Marinobacterium sp.]|nr:hypothetical protein [Marinobacterium sp.]
MQTNRKIRLAVSLISFMAIVVPFMWLLGAESTEAAFKEHSGWLIKYTFFWVGMMALLLMRNPRWFGEETPFDILLRQARRAINWLRVR